MYVLLFMNFNVESYIDTNPYIENKKNKDYHYLDWYSSVNIDSIIPILKNKFNYKYYISKYKDLSHMNYNEALYHWNKFGQYEGRNCCNKFNIFEYYFDYEFYTTIYTDLQHLNYDQALEHFTYNGIKEYRLLCNETRNTNLNIAVCVQLNNTNNELIEEIMSSIKVLRYIFCNLTIIISIPIFSQLENILLNHKNYDSSFIFLKILNPKNTNDVYPFLKSLQRLQELNIEYDYIIKLHNFNDCYSNFDKIKQMKTIQKLCNYYNVVLFEHYINKMNNIGYISIQENIETICNTELINTKLGISYKKLYTSFKNFPKQQISYVKGNMYWLNYKIIKQYLNHDFIDFFINNYNNCLSEFFQIIITGNLCYHKTNILINDIPLSIKHIKLGRLLPTFFKQPQALCIYKQNETL